MIRIVTSLAECRELWKKFSPHEVVWDEWSVMHAYHSPRHELHFLAHETHGVTDGLIPLVHDTKEKDYELFGGCYADNRKLWIRIDDFPEFAAAFPDNTSLFDLNGAHVAEIIAAHPEFIPNFTEHDNRYFLVPEEFGYDFTNHLTKLSGDKRKHLKAEIKKIQERNPVVQVGAEDESDLFITLCNKNFGDESDYQTDEGKDEIRRIINTWKGLGYLRTLTVTIDGNKEAVALCAQYNNTLTVAYSSSNNDIRNLGKFLNFQTIQEGCRLKVKEINYMTGMKWKADWKMNHETCTTFRKPARPSAEPISSA